MNTMAENNIPEQEVYEVDKLNLLDCKRYALQRKKAVFLPSIMRAGLITR